MSSDYFTIDRLTIHLAPSEEPEAVPFTPREDEMRLCKAAFGLTPDWRFDPQMTPLHFRLEGPPGSGKNEIVYEIARQMAASMNVPFYSIQGHEEMTPEDLSILTVPDPEAVGSLGFRLQASPLATALYEGALFFFDEINRVPSRALAPLSSVLDGRRSLYSATTGLTVRPKDGAKNRFRFCCALNPSASVAGSSALPDYIDERTLPSIKVGFPDVATLREILRSKVADDEEMLNAFETWYQASAVQEMSVRQAISLLHFAMRTMEGQSKALAIESGAKLFLRPEQLHGDSAPN